MISSSNIQPPPPTFFFSFCLRPCLRCNWNGSRINYQYKRNSNNNYNQYNNQYNNQYSGINVQHKKNAKMPRCYRHITMRQSGILISQSINQSIRPICKPTQSHSTPLYTTGHCTGHCSQQDKLGKSLRFFYSLRLNLIYRWH